MELDIRLPIGLMFLTLGAVLFATGLVQSVSLTTLTGGAMLAFGLPMGFFGWRAQRRQARAAAVATSAATRAS